MKLKTTLLSIVFLTIILKNNSASAQCALDQNQPVWDGGTSERNQPGYYDWQSFTAGISGGLCEVDVLYCNTTTLLVGTGTLNVYDGTGISGTLLTSQSVTVDGSSAATNTPFWEDFMIVSPPNIISGQVYTWQFIPTFGGGLTDPYLIQINIPDVYAGGVSYNFGTGGDIAFATHVDATMGISEIHAPVDVLVCPNPANEFISVKVNPEFVNAPYQIMDGLGRTVQAGELNSESTDISIAELARGIYFLKIGENQNVIKVVKK